MYRKTHRQFRNNQRFTGNITVVLVTYSVMLTRELRNSQERESRERQTDETDRRVSDDDVTSESHKSIAQTNRTNEVSQKNADVTHKNGMTKRHLGCSRATQVRMEYLRLVNLTEICPSRRVGHFKAPC